MCIIESVRKQLKENVDDEKKESARRFFKEEIRSYGVSAPAAVKIAKQVFKQHLKERPKEEVLGLCEELWQSGILEESFVACDWAYSLRDRFRETDFATFERWVNEYISNWASCDTLCNHTLGSFLTLYPSYAKRL